MLLSVDVGKGTTDIVLFEGNVLLKAIVPSSTTLLARAIEKTEENIVVSGYTMGGGPLASAIKNHLLKYKVFMTRNAALSLSDNVGKIESWGVEIIDEGDVTKRRGKRIFLQDLDMEFLRRLLEDTGFSFHDIGGCGLALQDHGFSLSSNRQNRFAIYRRILMKKKFMLPRLFFKKIPSSLTRARAAFAQISFTHKIFMDSSYAALLGIYYACGNCLAVNIGNGHTIAALLRKGEILGLFEHHTHLLTPGNLEMFLRMLSSGTLKNEDIFSSGGHGAFLRISQDLPIFVAGPGRRLMEKTSLSFEYAYPFGDVMIPGNLALTEIMKKLRWDVSPPRKDRFKNG
jgi:uncharacterized protein (DUF1786 family)